MDPYIPLLIWLASAVICIVIARVRHIKATLAWQFIVALLGPLAIPLLFIAKPASHYVPRKNSGTAGKPSEYPKP